MQAILALALAGGVAACTPERGTQASQGAVAPEYLGVETRLLDTDLVEFRLRMRGARDNADVAEYGKCAAARYALIRGYGFARHVRTNVKEDGGVWRGDAVYTISAALPRGVRTIDAEVAVADCADQGIPTV